MGYLIGIFGLVLIITTMAGLTLTLHHKYTWPILLRQLYLAPFTGSGQHQSVSIGYRVLDYLDRWESLPTQDLYSALDFEPARIFRSLYRLQTVGSVQINGEYVAITAIGHDALVEFQAKAFEQF
jgi:hypothetical protein